MNRQKPEGPAPEDEIMSWRRRIDDIDNRILTLLNQRAECAIRVGRVKRGRGLPIYDPARESRILDKVSKASQGPLTPESIRRLFERIIDESRSAERSLTEERSPARAKPPGVEEKDPQ